MNDFYKIFRPDRDDTSYLHASQVFTLCWGVIATALAFFVDRLGILIEASVKINTFFGGVLLGIFLLGMLSRRPRAGPTIVAAGIGLAVVSYFGLFTKLSFFWFGPLGCGVTLLCGYAISLSTRDQSVESTDGLVFNGLNSSLRTWRGLAATNRSRKDASKEQSRKDE